jgi:hypothetical protein
MKILMMTFLGLSLSVSSYAKECGPKPKATKNTLAAYVSCQKKSQDCLELKDHDGKVFKLSPAPALKLGVSKASLVNGQNGQLNISIDMDMQTSCWFEKITKENIGSKLAIVFNDEILIFPTIQAQIPGGKVLLSMGNRSSKSKIQKLCVSIYKNCKLDLVQNAKKNSPAFLDLSEFDRDKVNEKYSTVFESLFWYSDKKVITVYKSKEMKSGRPLTLSVIKSGSSKGKFSFRGFQEFDSKKNKFVYYKNAINIPLHGWIHRKDLVPSNILLKKQALEGMLTSYYVSKKCKKLTISLIEKQLKRKIPADYFLNQRKAFQSAQIGIKAAFGETEYIGMIKALEADLEARSCNKLYGVK